MGWLTDVGNIAVGAIERDRQITKEDLAIRAENLQANRNMLIKQKEKKYDKELENYYAEKKKFDDINDMNKRYESGAIDKGTYAAFALSSTMPGWDKLSKERKYELETNFDGKTIPYKLIGSPEEINKKAAAAQTIINDETSKRIKDAKGNSFLINTILGDKKKAEASLLEAMEGKLNAAETVKMTEQSTEHSGLDVKVGGEDISGNLAYKRFIKKNPKWGDRYQKLKDGIIYKSAAQNQNFMNFIMTTDGIGAATEGNFVLKNNDTAIEGTNAASRSMLKTYEMIYNNVVNEILPSELAAMGVDRTNLDKYVSLAEVNKRVQNIIEERGFRVDLGDGLQKGAKMDFLGVVPTNIVDKNGGFKLDSGATKYLNMQYVKNEYQNFLETEADKLIKTSPKRFQESKNKKLSAMDVVQKSVMIDGNYATKFKNSLKVDRDDPDTPENENITKHPKVIADEKMANEDEWAKKPPRIRDAVVKITRDDKTGDLKFRPNDKGVNKNIRISTDGTGFSQKQPNGNWKPITWEDVRKNNQVDKLPPLLKLKYDSWLAGDIKQAGNVANITNDTFTTNTNKFADMLEKSENEILNKKIKTAKKR